MSSKFQEFLQGFEGNEEESNKEKEINKANTVTEEFNINDTTNESTQQNEKKEAKPRITLKLKLNNTNIKTNNSKKEQTKEVVPIKNIENENNQKYNEIDLELLFKKSETSEKFKEKWMKVYNKAINSKKKNSINSKVREGKFRINNDGNIEIMPEFDTFGKTSKFLLNEHWNI